jgi:O-methyltransferase
MKSTIKKAVTALGLEEPARRIWLGLRRIWLGLKARGLMPWEPLVPEEAFSDCVAHCIRRLREIEPSEPFGDYLEFGVSRGTSLACVYRSLKMAGLHQACLIGFDSFEGMPPEAANEGWAEGRYHSTIEATRSYLRQKQVDLDRVTLVKGWFKDTLTEKTRQGLALEKASLIMVDCDIYSASKDALTFSEPHIRKYAVILFDDWGWREDLGEIGQKEAFAEFLAEHPDLTAEPLPAYLPQARVFLITRRG